MIQTCLSSADRNIQQLFVSVSLLNICPATRMSPPACTGGRREAFSLNQGTLTSTSVLCCTQVEVMPSWCERTCRRTWKARCNSDPAAPEKPSPSSVTQNVTAAPASPQWQITPQYCVCLKLGVSPERAALLLIEHTSSLPVFLNFLSVYKHRWSLALLVRTKMVIYPHQKCQ